MLERLREVPETVAPRHMSKLTLEDDIGMIHELTQVSRHNTSSHVGWVSGCLLQTAQTWANAGDCSASCAHAFGCMYVCLFVITCLFVCLFYRQFR